MLYAKINQAGDVVEFPYVFSDFPGTTPPSDAVPVDSTSLRPATTWNQKLIYDRVERSGDTYQLHYLVEVKFTTDQDKRAFMSQALPFYTRSNSEQFQATVKKLKQDYTDAEAESWPNQLDQAKRHLAGETTGIELLTSIAQARSMDISELANRIVANALAYNTAYGAALGKYQKNKEVLSSVDLDNPTTYDNIDLFVK